MNWWAVKEMRNAGDMVHLILIILDFYSQSLMIFTSAICCIVSFALNVGSIAALIVLRTTGRLQRKGPELQLFGKCRSMTANLDLEQTFSCESESVPRLQNEPESICSVLEALFSGDLRLVKLR